MKRMTLLQLKKGQKAKVADIIAGHGLEHKFMSMGIYRGKEIIKLSHFLLRGPVTIRVGRSVIALGHGMAAKILVE